MAATSGRTPCMPPAGAPSSQRASLHSAETLRGGTGAGMSMPGAHAYRGRAAPEPSTCESQAVNTSRGSSARASSIGTPIGKAVRSTSIWSPRASRKRPIESESQSLSTRSPAPSATAARASSTVSTNTDTVASRPGSEASSTASDTLLRPVLR